MDKKNKNPNVPNLRFKYHTNWHSSYLGEIVDYCGGGTPSTKNKSYWNGNIPWISSSDLYEDDIYKINKTRFITEQAIQNSATKLCPKESICIVSRVGVGKVAVTQQELCTSQDFFNIIKCNINKYFFAYQIQQKIKIAQQQGTSIKGITSKEIQNFKIWIPSENEQDKISFFLKLIDKRIQTQIKIIDDYVSLKNYLLKSFFQEFNEYDKLSTLIKFGKAGGTPKSTVKDYYDGDIPFLSISDITNQGKYIKHTIKHISQKGLNNSSAWLVPKNSLILSMYASVGLPTINRVPLATSQAMISMVLKNQHEVEFIYYYLCYFKKYKIRTFLETGTQSNINADIVKSIKIPKIKKDEKEKITDLLIKIDQLIDNEKQILDFHKKEKKYLLKNMFI